MYYERDLVIDVGHGYWILLSVEILFLQLGRIRTFILRYTSTSPTSKKKGGFLIRL